MGMRAAERLIDILNTGRVGNDDIELSAELVIGESCVAPRR